MKRLLILISIILIIFSFTACSLNSIDILSEIDFFKEEKAREKYSSCDKYAIEVIGQHEYEININSRIYRTLDGEESRWEPINNEIDVIGTSDYNGFVLIYKTSTPLCYKLTNVISKKTPDHLVYDTSVDFRNPPEIIKGYIWEEFALDKRIIIDDTKIVAELGEALTKPTDDSYIISENELDWLFEPIGMKIYEIPENDTYDGLCYDSGFRAVRRISDGAYCSIVKKDGNIYCTDITDLVADIKDSQ